MANRGKRTVSRRIGFSLIELLVVIGIIALLAAILAPALGRVRIAAQNQVGANHHRQLVIGIFAYAAGNNGYAPTDSPNRYDDFMTEPMAERAGGWRIWNEVEDNPRDGDLQGQPITRYLGLGHLIREDFGVPLLFFHPVMQDLNITGPNKSGHNWYYRQNIGLLSTDPDYLPNVTPPGNYLQNVGSNIAYRNSDFSTYVLNEAAVQPNLKIENNLVGEIGSSDKVILFDTPWENQGNRMGGQLGFTLQDGSVSSHSLAPFFGQAMQSSWSNADIQAVNAAGGYIWPLSPSQWGTNTDLSDGGAAAGWWAYMIDQR